MSIIVELQDEIGRMQQRGATLDTIDEVVIEPAPLSTDQKSALWLFAWSRISRPGERISDRLADVAAG